MLYVGQPMNNGDVKYFSNFNINHGMSILLG